MLRIQQQLEFDVSKELPLEKQIIVAVARDKSCLQALHCSRRSHNSIWWSTCVSTDISFDICVSPWKCLMKCLWKNKCCSDERWPCHYQRHHSFQGESICLECYVIWLSNMPWMSKRVFDMKYHIRLLTFLRKMETRKETWKHAKN